MVGPRRGGGGGGWGGSENLYTSKPTGERGLLKIEPLARGATKLSSPLSF